MDFLNQNEKLNLPVTIRQSRIKPFEASILFGVMTIIAIIAKAYIVGILLFLIITIIFLILAFKDTLNRETITLYDNVIVFEGEENITIGYGDISKLDFRQSLGIKHGELFLQIYKKGDTEICSKEVSSDEFSNKDFKKVISIILMRNPETILSNRAKRFMEGRRLIDKE